MTSPAAESYPTSVYKYYDADEILIYVGITRTGITRNVQHNFDKDWWPFVARQSVEHFENREAAHAREVELIRHFHPPFNLQHNSQHASVKASYLALVNSGALAIDVKRSLAESGKSPLALRVIEDSKKLAFSTQFADGAVVKYLRHSSKRRDVRDGIKTIGRITSVEVTGVIARINTSIRSSGLRPLVEAVAMPCFVSLKTPIVVEIQYVKVKFESDGADR